MSQPLLAIEGLKVELRSRDGGVALVDGVDLQIPAGRTLGLVGESGCGKSLTALALLRLLPDPPLHIVGGSMRLGDVDLRTASEKELRSIRGRRMAMVFQEPMTSLNPVMRCGEQVGEGLKLHLGMNATSVRARVLELLEEVGLDHPARRARQYPHELSGGMRQRIMIAMAIACGPELLIADEPTTALDVTVQARILELLDHLQASRGMSILHITHDLAVLAERAHELAVMYSGVVVESGPAGAILETPAHPYTLGLVACRPALGTRGTSLPTIPGQVPEPLGRPSGCRFRDRCPFATARCAAEEPQLRPLEGGRQVACHEAEAVRQAGSWPHV